MAARKSAALLSADLKLTPQVRDERASYFASWLKPMTDGKRAIFTAAAHAQRASDYLNAFSAERTGQRARVTDPRGRGSTYRCSGGGIFVIAVGRMRVKIEWTANSVSAHPTAPWTNFSACAVDRNKPLLGQAKQAAFSQAS